MKKWIVRLEADEREQLERRVCTGNVCKPTAAPHLGRRAAMARRHGNQAACLRLFARACEIARCGHGTPNRSGPP